MSVRIKFSEFFGFSDNFGEEEDDDNNKEEEDKDNDNEELYNRNTLSQKRNIARGKTDPEIESVSWVYLNI